MAESIIMASGKTLLTTLSKAPFDVPLVLEKIENEKLAANLYHLGLYEQSVITRLDESMEMYSVKIRGPKGEIVLGGGMGNKVIVHLDDGRRLPVLDMVSGESGHVEGFSGGRSVVDTLEFLGIHEDDVITMVRKLPHMNYVTRVVGRRRRVRMGEGDAAKLWGDMDGRHLQFSMASVGAGFMVRKVLGGRRAAKRMSAMGIWSGSELVLEQVEPADSVGFEGDGPVVISTDDGLHLHLQDRQGDSILVSVSESGGN